MAFAVTVLLLGALTLIGLAVHQRHLHLQHERAMRERLDRALRKSQMLVMPDDRDG